MWWFFILFTEWNLIPWGFMMATLLLILPSKAQGPTLSSLLVKFVILWDFDGHYLDSYERLIHWDFD